MIRVYAEDTDNLCELMFGTIAQMDGFRALNNGRPRVALQE
jgi:hypothetical protein